MPKVDDEMWALVDRVVRADAGGRPVEEAPEAATGPDGLAQRRHVDDTDGRALGVVDGEEVAVEGDAVGERLGAVDGVDGPGAPARADAGLLLLADDRVVGVAAGDLLAQEALGGLVGRGDRRAVTLALDVERRRRGTTGG